MKKETVNIGYVYKITNNVNGKIYIGETIQSIEKRFKQHMLFAYYEEYKNYYFYRAIRKYGEESFSLEILETVENIDRSVVKQEILKLEEHYIDHLDSMNNGYNSISGGREHKEVSIATRELQSRRKKEDPLTSERAKHARSFYINDRKVTAYNYYTAEPLKTFDSIKNASEFYNVDSSGITKVCKGDKNYLGTLEGVKITWRYAEDIYEPKYTIKVFNLEGKLLGKFVDVSQAAKEHNIKYHESILRCCKGINKTTGRRKEDKLVWRFYEDEFNKF